MLDFLLQGCYNNVATQVNILPQYRVAFFLIKTQAHFSIPLLCVKTCVAQASRVFFVRGFGCALFVFVRGFGFSSDELLKNISFECF